MATTIRLALPSDEPQIAALLAIMHTEESIEPVDEAKTRSILNRLINQDGGIVGVVRGKNHIEGTIGLTLETFWYSSSPHLQRLWLFVHPDHRKSTHAKELLIFCKMYSDAVGVPLMANEILGANTEKKIELVGRQLPEAGKLYLYNRRKAEPLAVAS